MGERWAGIQRGERTQVRSAHVLLRCHRDRGCRRCASWVWPSAMEDREGERSTEIVKGEARPRSDGIGEDSGFGVWGLGPGADSGPVRLP